MRLKRPRLRTIALLCFALAFAVLQSPAQTGPGLIWDPVTVDIDGFPELGVITYSVETRIFHSADPWIELGTTVNTTFPRTIGINRMEYRVFAIDEAGNRSEPSNVASAPPEKPNKPKVTK